ncbi:MAG TPA: nucleotidyl transferase AbiEii/AbiGii toxin family protein [Polyangia bacterium]
MKDLLAEAAAVVARTTQEGGEIALIGGLAVHVLVGFESRQTVDIDFVARGDAGLEALGTTLEERGYLSSRASPWWRFQRESPRVVVDASRDAVVDPRTFDVYRVEMDRVSVRASFAGPAVPCVALEDLVALKLLAGRDQDLVDLVLLASRVRPGPDIARIQESMEMQDLERALAGAGLRAEAALADGSIGEAYAALTGRELDRSEAAGLAELLRRLRGAAP